MSAGGSLDYLMPSSWAVEKPRLLAWEQEDLSPGPIANIN